MRICYVKQNSKIFYWWQIRVIVPQCIKCRYPRPWAMGIWCLPNVILDEPTLRSSSRSCGVSYFSKVLHLSLFSSSPPTCFDGMYSSMGGAGVRENQSVESNSQQAHKRHIGRRIFVGPRLAENCFLTGHGFTPTASPGSTHLHPPSFLTTRMEPLC